MDRRLCISNEAVVETSSAAACMSGRLVTSRIVLAEAGLSVKLVWTYKAWAHFRKGEIQKKL